MKEENKKLVELAKIPEIKISCNTEWLLKHSMGDNMNVSDIMIRILAIENFYGKNNYGFKLYNKMQKIRVRNNPKIPQFMADNQERFITLIKSFEKNGYLEEYPIIINNSFKLFNGTHRLACSLYFNIKNVPVTFEERVIEYHPDYSIDWFRKEGLESYIPIIKSKYKEILEKRNKNE